MQPVLNDLRAYQKSWNQGGSHFFRNEEAIRQNVKYEERPIYLRVLHVALLALIVFTVSTSVCLTVSGLIAPIREGGVLIAFGKLFLGGFFGVISYDLIRLRPLVDRCRSIFREVNYCIKNNKIPEEMRGAWNRDVEYIERNYRDLYIVDTVLDTLYSAVVNY